MPISRISGFNSAGNEEHNRQVKNCKSEDDHMTTRVSHGVLSPDGAAQHCVKFSVSEADKLGEVFITRSRKFRRCREPLCVALNWGPMRNVTSFALRLRQAVD